MNGNSVSVSMEKFSEETLTALRAVPDLKSLVVVFPDETDEELHCMLVAYTEVDPAVLAEVISKMDNIKYAWATPPRRLVMPVKE